ncbi:MAG: Stp1/IreP family PP2C-type Ser/Thr phosphatase [Chloroflexi bacterium]|nr:MAG: Stp1/IreP family PP2C-type Ser/Thr phosphatase [Chloroflexota bacterium]
MLRGGRADDSPPLRNPRPPPVTSTEVAPHGSSGVPPYGARSDVGRVRDVNEDRFVVHPPLFLVADGMGGQNAGDVAAGMTADMLEAAVVDGTIATPADLRSAIERANRAVHDRAATDDDLAGMGTTCTAMLIVGSRIHLAHAGDSRAYLLRDGGLRQLTVDHTLVQRLVDEGRASAEDVARHPQRNVILRAVGAAADLEVEELDVDIRPGDRVLLCSDGLTGAVPTDEIAATLRDVADPAAAAARLVDLANAAGGADNVTAIVVDPERVTGTSPGAVPRRREPWRRRFVGAALAILAAVVLALAAARQVTAPAVPVTPPPTTTPGPASPSVAPSIPASPSPAVPSQSVASRSVLASDVSGGPASGRSASPSA